MMKLSTGLFFLFLSISISAQNPEFRHYTVNDGLANSTVYSARQDSKGYIWFCTESGVNRFDGNTFETFSIADGLADNENFKCIEDSKGRIWFMSYNGKLSYYQYGRGFVNEKTDTTLKYKAESVKYIVDMEEDKEGNIWFARSQEFVFMYDGKKVIGFPESERRYDYKILFKNKGYVNIFDNISVDQTCRVDLLHNKKTLLSKQGVRVDMGNIVKQYITPDAFYFNSYPGIRLFRNDTIYTVLLDEQLNLTRHIGCFLITGNDLWFEGRGLMVIPDFLTKGYQGNYKHYLEDIALSSIIKDHEGGMWITTLTDGVYYVRNSQLDITNISLEAVNAVSHHKGSNRWAMGTYYGDLFVYSGDSLTDHYRYQGVLANRIKALKWLSKDSLMVGMDFETFIYNVRTKTAASVLNLPMIGYVDMDEDEGGLCMASRGMIFLKNHSSSAFKKVYGEYVMFSNERIVSVAAGGKAGCWFARVEELFSVDYATGKATFIAGPEVFASNLKDLQYVNGYLWVATDGNGIFIFKNGKLIRHIYSKNSSITGDVCQKLIDDGNGRMWVATNKGISIFNTKSYQYEFGFTSKDVLINEDIKDIEIIDGKVYVATPSGISSIDIAKFISVTEPPKVYIKSLQVDKKDYSVYSSPEFKYTNGIITLSYQAITFQSQQALRYRYKISSQQNWNETNTNQIEFVNLAPGKYILQLSAKKYNSGWSKPISFSFTVTPLWYQTWWFKLAIAFAGTFIIYLIFRWQVKSIEKRESEKTLYNKKIAELEGNALANQMNPHFIFNSLNTVQQFILRKDEKQVLNYLADFATLIRQILKYSRQPFISLRDEVDFLQRYMELEQIRFNNKFNFDFDIDENMFDEELEIPPMLIQPLLENAVKHGLTVSGGQIHMKMYLDKEQKIIMVNIEDNGYGINVVKNEALKKREKSNSTALKVIESRLKLLSTNDRRGVLIIADKKEMDLNDSGTKVSLHIPIN